MVLLFLYTCIWILSDRKMIRLDCIEITKNKRMDMLALDNQDKTDRKKLSDRNTKILDVIDCVSNVVQSKNVLWSPIKRQ